MIQSVNRIDSYVGSRVRFQRSLLGMSESVFADAIGVTERQLQEYECGAVRIGAQHLLKITKILKVSAAFFFDGLASEGARRIDNEARRTADDGVADAASAAKESSSDRPSVSIRDAKARRALITEVEAIVSAEPLAASLEAR